MFTDEERKRIAARYMAGESSGLIAQSLGVSHPIVMDCVRLFGTPRSRSEAIRLANSSGRRDSRKQGDALRRYTLNQNTFVEELTPATAWLLGVIVGDGCVTRVHDRIGGVDIVGDKDVCAKAAVILGSDTPITDKGNYGNIRFHSPFLGESLSRFGIGPKKSHTLQWPEQLPESLESHFLRGFWDADGCITHQTRQRTKGLVRYLCLSACSCSRAFMESVRSRVCAISGSSTNLIARRGGDYFIQVGCNKAACLGEWLYAGSTPEIRGDRKYERFLELRSV